MRNPLEIFALSQWYDIPVEALRFDFLQNRAELVLCFPKENEYEHCSLFFEKLVSFRSELPEGEPFTITGLYEAKAEWNEKHQTYEIFFIFQVGEHCVPLWKVSIACMEISFSQNWSTAHENILPL